MSYISIVDSIGQGLTY